MTAKHRIYTMTFSSVYPHYVAKAEKKGRTKSEVDEIIRWLTGYSQRELEALIEEKRNFEAFFQQAPGMNPAMRGDSPKPWRDMRRRAACASALAIP